MNEKELKEIKETIKYLYDSLESLNQYAFYLGRIKADSSVCGETVSFIFPEKPDNDLTK